MNKKIFMLLICIILMISNVGVADSKKAEKIYEVKIEIFSSYFTYYIYENELTRLNNGEEDIILYSSTDDLIDDKQIIFKTLNDKSLIEYKLFANSLFDFLEEEIIKESRTTCKKMALIGATIILGLIISAVVPIILIKFFDVSPNIASLIWMLSVIIINLFIKGTFLSNIK